MDEAQKSTSETSSTRWWESYLVRYFTGFIVGSICIIILLHHVGLIDYFEKYLALKYQQENSKIDWTPVLFISTLLGISYCYLVSAPITVLHAGRYLPRSWITLHARHFWISWAIVTLFIIFQNAELLIFNNGTSYTALTIALLASHLLPTEVITNKNSDEFDKSIFNFIEKFKSCFLQKLKNKISDTAINCLLLTIHSFLFLAILVSIISITTYKSTQLSYFILSLPAIWVGVSQYFILIRMLMSNKDYITYYQQLSKARQMKGSKDIRDTYTHLREHSNAIFIVILEISVLSMIFNIHHNLPTVVTINQLPDLTKLGQFIMAALAFWLIPTMFMWARANVLERDFSKNPESFIHSLEKSSDTHQTNSQETEPTTKVSIINIENKFDLPKNFYNNTNIRRP